MFAFRLLFVATLATLTLSNPQELFQPATLMELSILGIQQIHHYLPATHNKELRFISTFAIDVASLSKRSHGLIQFMSGYPSFALFFNTTITYSAMSPETPTNQIRIQASAHNFEAVSRRWQSFKLKLERARETLPDTRQLIDNFIIDLQSSLRSLITRSRQSTHHAFASIFKKQFITLCKTTLQTISQPDVYARLSLRTVLDVKIVLAALKVPMHWLEIGLQDLPKFTDEMQERFAIEFATYKWRWEMALEDASVC